MKFRCNIKGHTISAQLLVLSALLLCGSMASLGQQITGTIIGEVKDEQGALIQAANIKATNIATGFSRSTVSGAQGTYRLEYLPVGRYSVQVTATGFKKFVQENLVLTVDQTQVLNATLAVGEQNQTITVTEAPPLVDTSSVVLGRTIESAEIVGLPLVNRNAYAQISLTPGVQANSASAQSNPSGSPNFIVGAPATAIQINGGIDAGVPTVSFYLDGGLNISGIRNYGQFMPNPDALEEFRVETNNFAAQYGRMSGAVITAVTRSGTNQFHGSLFEFNRNTDFNATPWNSTFNAPYHRNQFGGTVGGPIKRNKAFFFFSYAGLRQSVGQQLTGAVVPTAAERLGDFTADSFTVYLPGTKTQVNGSNSGPNCGTPQPNCIPQSLLDKTAANILTQYIPLPTGANNTWTGYYTSPMHQDEYLGKYDEMIGEKDHVAVSYFTIQTTNDAYGSGNIPYMINRSYSRQQNVNLSDIHTLTSTTINQAWVNFIRAAGGRVNLPTIDLGDLGSSFTIQGPSTLPQLGVTGYFSAGGALAGPVSTSDIYTIRDMVSTNKGKHSLVVGGEMSLEHDMFAANLDNFGVFSFSASAPTTTGNALSDFVTGQVNSMEQDTPYSGLLSSWYFGGFLQDSYRILPRLTLSLGLRYDVQTSPVESQDRALTFVSGTQSTLVPSAPLGVLFAGDKDVPRGIAGIRWHHVSPRVGFAWDPRGDGKTAIRAGAGIFYGSVSGNEWNQPANAQPFAVRQVFQSITSLTDIYSNKQSFPNGDPFPYNYDPKNPRFLPAASVETIARDYQWPLVYQFNAAVEHQLPSQIGVSVAYVGTLSHHTPFSADENSPVYADGASTTQASINARRPYDPGVLGQVWYIESTQTASYHSLQISARRPLSRHLMLNGFYVFSKTFWSAAPQGTGISAPQNFYALWEERGLADSDQRHSASISGMWNVDYYRGTNAVLKYILNGWTISPIVTLHSGSPFNILTGLDKNFDSYANDRPNLVTGQSAKLDPNRSRSVSRNAWFNTAAFTSNGAGLGIGPGGADGTTPRDYLTGPGYRDIDLGLLRDFRFERGIVFQLRGEAINAFNMVSLNSPTANLASSLNSHITSAASPRLIQVGGRLTF